MSNLFLGRPNKCVVSVGTVCFLLLAGFQIANGKIDLAKDSLSAAQASVAVSSMEAAGPDVAAIAAPAGSFSYELAHARWNRENRQSEWMPVGYIEFRLD